MALAKALRNETNNSKFAKRTWNVTWNQQFHFWRLTSPSQIGRGGQAGRSRTGSPQTGAESQATLTAKELNELHALSC